MISTKPRRPPPGGLLALIFAGYVPLASHNPYPIIVFSVANIVDPIMILVTLGEICNFCDPKLVTFYLCIYLINPLNRSSKNELTYFFNKLNEEHFTFHLQYSTVFSFYITGEMFRTNIDSVSFCVFIFST